MYTHFASAIDFQCRLYATEDIFLKNKFTYNAKKLVSKRKAKVTSALRATVLALAVLFLVLVVALFVDVLGMKIKYTLEAGDPLPSSDEISGRRNTEYDLGDYDGDSFNKVGKYTIHVLDGSRKIKVELSVVDTKAPEFELLALNVNKNGPYPEAIDFFKNVVEPSAYSARYLGEFDLASPDAQEIQIKISDEHGNSKTVTTSVTMIEDRTPPTMSVPATITTYLGEAIAYTKSVTVTDNCFGDVSISVNTDAVNPNKVGKYKIIYTATDAAGNSSSVTTTLEVLERRITRDELMVKIAALSTRLGITKNLSDEEKCRRIYGYVNSPTSLPSAATIVFTDESNTDRSDWIREAYLTLERGSGDCYSYFAVSKAFFEYFGIENRDIERSEGVTTQVGTHFWSMVKLENGADKGWYYYDATRLLAPHNTGSGCLFTEAQLVDYNTNVKIGFLTYDHTGYPTASSKTINEGYTW